MKIETYEVEEITGEMGVMAADAESSELIDRLGLDGQKTLITPETCTRFPYRLMTPMEHKIFSICFPERTELEKYSDSIIPLRVLQVAAFCRETHPTPWHGLYVWHCGSAKEDPLLVGHTKNYSGQFYLLARWGDSLEPMEKLAKKAKEIWKFKAKARIAKEINEWQSDGGLLDTLADELFLTGKITSGHNGYHLSEV